MTRTTTLIVALSSALVINDAVTPTLIPTVVASNAGVPTEAMMLVTIGTTALI